MTDTRTSQRGSCAALSLHSTRDSGVGMRGEIAHVKASILQEKRRLPPSALWCQRNVSCQVKPSRSRYLWS